MAESIEFLTEMYLRLYQDRFYGTADHYRLLLEKLGVKFDGMGPVKCE